MNTTKKGNLSQSKVICRLLELGYSVFLPFGDGEKADLVYETPNGLVRAQIKTGTLSNGIISCNVVAYTRSNKPIDYSSSVDVFLIYCPQTLLTYVIPISLIRGGKIYMRADDTKRESKLAKRSCDFVL